MSLNFPGHSLRCGSLVRKVQISPRVWIFLQLTRKIQEQIRNTHIICTGIPETSRIFPGSFRTISDNFPEHIREMAGTFPGNVQDISGTLPKGVDDPQIVLTNRRSDFGSPGSRPIKTCKNLLKPDGPDDPVLDRHPPRRPCTGLPELSKPYNAFKELGNNPQHLDD